MDSYCCMRMVQSEESLVWKYILKLNDRFWPVALVFQVISGIDRFLNTVEAHIKKEQEGRAKTQLKNIKIQFEFPKL
jgi:hypothetical protein